VPGVVRFAELEDHQGASHAMMPANIVRQRSARRSSCMRIPRYRTIGAARRLAIVVHDQAMAQTGQG